MEHNPSNDYAVTARQTNHTRNDFEFGTLLGEGSYAKVMFAKHRASGKEYAIKIVDKAFIVKQKKEHFVTTEKRVLSMVAHPNIIKLYSTFRDGHSLYFVLELASGGELFRQIRLLGKCPNRLAQFYSAELVSALIYLHSMGIIHRDVKPENVLLSADGHIRLADFGTAKILETVEEAKHVTQCEARRGSFVGTAEFIAPEVLNNEAVGFGVDWWALGCVIFQLLSGRPPFRGENDFPPDARHLVEQFLVLKSELRLGCRTGGTQEIMDHPFFSGVDFQRLPMLSPPSFTLPSVPLDEESETVHYEVHEDKNASEQVDDDSKWNVFLVDGERIAFHGLVSKRKGLFAKKRCLILTTMPRLLYIDIGTMEQRGEIQWSDSLWAELKNEDSDDAVFFIHTPGRSYYLQGLSCSSREWVEAINTLLKSGKSASLII